MPVMTRASRRRTPRPTWIIIALAAACVASVGCGGRSSGGGSGLDTPLDPSRPPAGLDTAQRQLIDGAGNAGPVRARLLSIRPDLNALVVGTTATSGGGSCNQSSPWSCFEFSTEVCVDALPNPTNSVLLSNMKIAAVFSSDGTTPISRGGFPYPLTPAGLLVQPGTCKSYQTALDMKPNFPAEGVPRFFVIVVSYGSAPGFIVNQAACPTPDAITSSGITTSPNCSFRQVYDLGFHY